MPASIRSAVREYLDAYGLALGAFDFALAPTGDGGSSDIILVWATGGPLSGRDGTAARLSVERLPVIHFQYWRDGKCVEYFEPGMEHTRSEPHGPWWDRVEAALAAQQGEDAGVAPAVALVLDHLGIALDDATLAGPWPGLTLAEDNALPVSAPLGDTYAGEGAVLPGPVEVL